MNDLLRGLLEATRLIGGGDAELAEIVLLSLRVSGLALLISTLIGVPIGVALGLTRTRAHGLITAILYTGMGLPPVVVGLFVYLMLSRSGPFGVLGWLFTPSAMIAAQTIIALPLVTGLTMTAVRGVDPALRVAWFPAPDRSAQVLTCCPFVRPASCDASSHIRIPLVGGGSRTGTGRRVAKLVDESAQSSPPALVA